jgi:uncharacterized repeat protein (TIGR03803 family)
MPCIRRFGIVRPATLAAVALLALTIGAGSAQAWTLKVLYTFKGGADGYEPSGHLVRDGATGEFYGNTVFGGQGDCGSPGCGVVFKLASDGTETVLYTFTGGADGGRPEGSLIRDPAGNLYGTTQYGGDPDCDCGVVFRLAADGKYKVLYTFSGPDGGAPSAGLLRDAHTGDIYGTTLGGGKDHYGTVFKLATDGTLTQLHSFSGGNDGRYPQNSSLIKDGTGNLYGTTPSGGDPVCSCGIVFKIAPNGSESILYTFTRKTLGEPLGGLVSDKLGNLYGTGAGYFQKRHGMVFRLSPDNALKVLYRFARSPDAAVPVGDLLRTRSGTIYGTSYYGGAHDAGTVFQLKPDGTEQVLASFGYGAFPGRGVIADGDGNLYGTTALDGSGYGTVFELVK